MTLVIVNVVCTAALLAGLLWDRKDVRNLNKYRREIIHLNARLFQRTAELSSVVQENLALRDDRDRMREELTRKTQGDASEAYL